MKRMKKTLTYKISRLLLVCLFIAGLLQAPPTAAGEIEYQIMPYLWTSGIDAELGPPGRTTSADVSFSDYAEFIDLGAAFVFEARGDKWSFISDVLLVKLSEDIDLPAGTVDFEQDQLILELAVGYSPEGWKETRIYGGVRYLEMDTTIEFRDRFEVGIGQHWADPFVGLEWRPRRGKWEHLIEGDIGGGVDADFTWSFMAGTAYHYSDRFAVTGGYRLMDIDFEDSEFVFDGTLEGLQIGLLIKF